MVDKENRTSFQSIDRFSLTSPGLCTCWECSLSSKSCVGHGRCCEDLSKTRCYQNNAAFRIELSLKS